MPLSDQNSSLVKLQASSLLGQPQKDYRRAKQAVRDLTESLLAGYSLVETMPFGAHTQVQYVYPGRLHK